MSCDTMPLTLRWPRCMIKIFMGGRGGGWKGGSSERWVIKETFQKHFKIGGG